MPGTVVPIHRHPMSNENVLCLCGKLVEVLEPCVIYEAKDGAYGQDGSETYPSLREPQDRLCSGQAQPMKKLKEQITYLIGMERADGNLEPLSAEYISRMLNVPLAEVESCLQDLQL